MLSISVSEACGALNHCVELLEHTIGPAQQAQLRLEQTPVERLSVESTEQAVEFVAVEPSDQNEKVLAKTEEFEGELIEEPYLNEVATAPSQPTVDTAGSPIPKAWQEPIAPACADDSTWCQAESEDGRCAFLQQLHAR